MPITNEFDPAQNGWYFSNQGGFAPSLSSDYALWNLYRETYLGINPTNDPVEAPLDCFFYENCFKQINAQGNCGGMSLLALALFKYGGYMGFCSPASAYCPTESTLSSIDEDLFKAINILQARQFSAPGVENFLDVGVAGMLNNADAAFARVKGLLSKGDYPVLCIATSLEGGAAHTVIPYRVEGSLTSYPKIMYIWDSNHPFDDDPTHYHDTSSDCQLVINGPTDWTYTSQSRTYAGSLDGWCFAVPMSLILRKAPQPMSLSMIGTALGTFLVNGPGAAVSQISDDKGHRFYKTEADEHLSTSDLETDPSRRLKEMVRWPWFGRAGDGELPGELYLMRRRAGNTPLNLTVSGTEYKVTNAMAGNLIEIDVKSSTRSRDTIKISGLSTAAQSLEIKALGEPRTVNIRQLRVGRRGAEWKSVSIKNVNVPREGLVINMVDDLAAVEVLSADKAVEFEMEVQQRFGVKVSTRDVGRLSTVSGRVLRVASTD